MSSPGPSAINQRYARLADRSRSQWTFYQYLQGLFKHLFNSACPVEIDFPSLFSELRSLAPRLASPDTARTQGTITEIDARLDAQGRRLLELDGRIAPSLLRRFFDHLRNQDEKVLVAIIKFYLDGGTAGQDTLDKLDILFTRLAEIPRDSRGSVARERAEVERLVLPLMQMRPPSRTPDAEIGILLGAITDLKSEALACQSFTELAAGGALDRFRTLKRRLGEDMLHPRLLPALLEATVSVKNRFRELWEQEETSLLADSNKVRELQRQLAGNPEMVTADLREMFEVFSTAQRRFEEGRQTENLRREDALQLRMTLNHILEQFDITQLGLQAPPAVAAEEPAAPSPWETSKYVPPSLKAERLNHLGPGMANDPLLREHLSKILFALDLAGGDRPAAEVVASREMASLRLEPCEIEACRDLLGSHLPPGSIACERAQVLLQGAALRNRLDDEAREILRLHKRGSEQLPEALQRSTQSLQRVSELERRLAWLVEDAVYRGDTEYLERLHRCRFRLMRVYSGLWLVHNERGGISPF
jgi:hypothetical protein